MNVECLFSLRLSLQVATLSTLFLAIVVIPLAWPFARRSFPGKQLVEALISLPLVLPPTVLGYYLVVLLGRRGTLGRYLYEATGWTPVFTWWGALIASMVVAFPLLFHATVAAIAAVDPELEQAAETMGASWFTTFRLVTLPLARGGVLSGVALAFARALGEFGATMMIAGNIPGQTTTMPLAIYNAFASGTFNTADHLALLYLGLSVLILWPVMRWKDRTSALFAGRSAAV